MSFQQFTINVSKAAQVLARGNITWLSIHNYTNNGVPLCLEDYEDDVHRLALNGLIESLFQISKQYDLRHQCF